MLRKKWQIKTLIVLLASSLMAPQAVAMDWLPSRASAMSTASYLLSVPGSALMQLGGYTGINNLLSRMAPERWSNMTLQDRRAVVALISALVWVAMTFLSLATQPVNVNDSAAIKSSISGQGISTAEPIQEKTIDGSSEEQAKVIDLLSKEMQLADESLKAVIKTLQSSATSDEQALAAIKMMKELIEAINEKIRVSTFISKAVSENLNKQLEKISYGLKVASGVFAAEIILLINMFNTTYKEQNHKLSTEQEKEFNQDIQRFLGIINSYIRSYGPIDKNLEGLRQQLLNIQAGYLSSK